LLVFRFWKEVILKMFLSRLKLNPLLRAVRRDLSDCREMHRTVMSVFPAGAGETPRHEYGVLYRIDTPNNGLPQLYVQSEVIPDWTRLPADYLIEQSGNPACKRVGSHYDNLREGMALTFLLRANPTKKIGTSSAATRRAGGPTDNGQRVPLTREEDQMKWLKRKAMVGGFELLTLSCNSTVDAVDAGFGGMVYGGRRVGERRLVFSAVNFRGLLRIIDAECFRATLRQGIGPGKAYGFGLLSIAPARYQ
jgi:CRISPR system Cascade subunit CasE